MGYDPSMLMVMSIDSLSGPNGTMPPRCAMAIGCGHPQIESDAKSIVRLQCENLLVRYESQEPCYKIPSKIMRCWHVMRDIGVYFNIERYGTLAIRILTAVWPAMRAHAMPNR